MKLLGMDLDSSGRDQSEGTYKFARNGVLHRRKLNSVSNEEGFEEIVSLEGYHVLKFVTLSEESIVVFSINPTGVPEIGIVDYLSYSVSLCATGLNFNDQHPIEASIIYSPANDPYVIFTDNLNPTRYLNLNNPQLAVDGNGTPITDTSLESLSYFHNAQVPQFELQGVKSHVGGALTNGVYYLYLRYVDSDYSATRFVGRSSMIAIDEPSSSTTPGELTGFMIDLKIDNLDTRYKYFQIGYIYYKENKATEANILLKNYPISSEVSLVTITGHEEKESTVNSELALPPVNYTTAKALSISNNTVYLGNLKENVLEDFQKYVNYFKVKWTAEKQISLDGENYKNAITVYNAKGFRPGEVYALYAVPVLKNGVRLQGYHIPGRAPVDIAGYPGQDETTFIKDLAALPSATNDLAVSPNVRYFHTRETATGTVGQKKGEMGFWQNENEFYPATEDFTVVNGATGAYQGSIRSQNVRHHRFPTVRQLISWGIKPSELLDTDMLGEQTTADITLSGASLSVAAALNPMYVRRNVVFSTEVGATAAAVMENSNIDLKNNTPADAQANVNFSISYTGTCTVPELHGAIVFKLHIQKIASTDLGSGVLLTQVLYSDTSASASTGATISLTGVAQGSTEMTLGPGEKLRIFATIDSPADSVDFSGGVSDEDVTLSLESYGALDAAGESLLNGSVFTRPLGLVIEDINLPAEIADQLQGIEIHYASRTQGNMSVLSQVGVHYKNELNDALRLHPYDFLAVSPHPAMGATFMRTLYKAIVKEDTAVGSNTLRNFVHATQAYTASSDADMIRSLSNVKYIPHNIDDVGEIPEDNTLGEEYVHAKMSALSYAIGEYPEQATVADLCVHRTNLYADFYSQQTVATGAMLPIEGSDAFSGGVYAYGGDNFKSIVRTDLHDVTYLYRYKYALDTISNVAMAKRLASDVNEEIDADFDKTLQRNYYYSPVFHELNKYNGVICYNPFGNDESHKPFHIIRGQEQDREGQVNTYRNFSPLEYFVAEKKRGEIQKLVSFHQGMLIHHREGLYTTVSKAQINTDETAAYLGNADIFRVEPKELTESDGGIMGTYNPSGAVLTEKGYVFVDGRNKRVYLISKEGQLELSSSKFKLSNFFEKQLDFSLIEFFRSKGEQEYFQVGDSPFSSSGIGYVIWYEAEHNRIMFSKRDYKVNIPEGMYKRKNEAGLYEEQFYKLNSGYLKFNDGFGSFEPVNFEDDPRFEPNHFTLSFSLDTMHWTFFHDYAPGAVGIQKTTPITCTGSKSYMHGSGLPGMYYKEEPFAFYIDMVANPEPLTDKILQTVKWESEALDAEGVPFKDVTLDGLAVYNDRQYSGILDLTTGRRFARDQWQFNSFRDLSNDTPFIDEFGILDPAAVDVDKPWYERKRFKSKYIILRLICSNIQGKTLHLYQVVPMLRKAFR